MRVFFDDKGFSTVGTALALLLTLSLIFSASRVYRLSSEAAFVQDVADAAVLAAQNEVAEYMVAVRVCDAVVLTLSLTGLALYGVGVAALCVPSGSSVAAKLLKIAEDVIEMRDDFAQRAQDSLLRIARSLPFLAAVNAASVAAANGNASGSSYFAAAFLVPSSIRGETSSEDVQRMKDDASAAKDSVEERVDDIQREAAEADTLAQDALTVKEEGYLRDCGDAPDHCMSERAAVLARLSGRDNPTYSSVDAWTFSVALERARSYYKARLENEVPLDSSVEEGARSALRRVFYEYALDELEKAYVHESESEFDVELPLMPCNVEEMRKTTLYTDPRYPVTIDESGRSVMHAWDGCPQAQSAMTCRSVAAMEQQGFATCFACGFTAASLGKVAAATSAVETGFEFHYNMLVELAEEYEEAWGRMSGKADNVRAMAQEVFDAIAEAMRSASKFRIGIVPPGSQGAIAMAVALPSVSSEAASDPFVTASGSLGICAAVSAATMLDDESKDGQTVISSLLDGLKSQGGVMVGAASIAMQCWSGFLQAYGSGQDAISAALRDLLDAIPLAGSSGLGKWAKDAFEESVSALGLQPAKLGSLKPVLVNSGYVAGKGSDAFAVRFVQLKKAAVQASGPSSSLFSSVVSSFEEYLVDEIDSKAGSIELAVIDIPALDISVPITIALPVAAVDSTTGFLRNAANAVRSAYAQITGVKVWE